MQTFKAQMKRYSQKWLNTLKVYYKKFWEHAKVPHRATPFSAGSDLYSAFEYCVPKEGQTAIDTGIGAVDTTYSSRTYLLQIQTCL